MRATASWSDFRVMRLGSRCPAAIVGIGALLATAVFPRVSQAKRAALAAPPEPRALEERG